MIEKIILVKKKKNYKYNLGLKNYLLTLDDYLRSCGRSSGRVGGGCDGVGGGRVGGASGSFCKWL